MENGAGVDVHGGGTLILAENQPLVTVVMPVYNHARYVGEAIRSVLDQTYRPIELVIIDDGSTDGSVEAIRSYLAAHPPPDGVAVHVETRGNRGAHATINDGIARARGAYVAILNSDDSYHPERLAACLAALLARDARFALTYVTPVGDDGRPLDLDHPWRDWYRHAVALELEGAPSLGFVLLRHNLVVSTGNIVVRRDLLDEIGPFADLRYAHDLDFTLRAAAREEPVLVRRKLYRYRVHGANTIGGPGREVDAECARLYADYLRATFAQTPPNPGAPSFARWPSSLAAEFGGRTPPLDAAIDSLLETAPETWTAPARRAESSARGKPERGHVTLVSHELSRTGAPALILGVAAAMREAGIDVGLIAVRDGPLRAEFERLGVPVRLGEPGPWARRVIRLGGIVAGLAARLRLPGPLRRGAGRIEAVLRRAAMEASLRRLVRHARGTLLINSFAAWPLALRLLRLWRGPSAWYIHETYDLQHHLGGRRDREIFDARTRGTTFLYGSEATRAVWAGEGYDGRVAYWSGLSRADGAAREAPRRPVILSVGVTGTRKGTVTLIEAFAEARRRRRVPDDAELVIVGCLPPSTHAQTRDLLVRAHADDLRGRVRLVGLLPAEALDAHYRAATLYVQSSNMECLPLALLAAMAHALPIVTTDVDGCPEAILDGVCGLTVPPREPTGMAEAIGALFADPARAQAFGAAARRRFEEAFSLEATAEPLIRAVLGDSDEARATVASAPPVDAARTMPP